MDRNVVRKITTLFVGIILLTIFVMPSLALTDEPIYCPVRLQMDGFNIPNRGSVSGASETYTMGSTVTVVATPEDGYIFEGWYDTDFFIGDDLVKVPEADAAYTFLVTAPRTLVAKFIADKNSSSLKLDLQTYGQSIVIEGGKINLATSLSQLVPSNAAMVTYKFDSTKYQYDGTEHLNATETDARSPVLITEVVEDGIVNITYMFDEYSMNYFDLAVFTAKADVNLQKDSDAIDVSVSFVWMDTDGSKSIKTVTASTADGEGILGDTNGDGVVDLIDLSNMVDWFGYNTDTPEWETKYINFDFNKDGTIDISDISFIAKLIIAG